MRSVAILLSFLFPALMYAQNTSKLPNNTGSSKYVVFAWNDLGMHCLNPTYDQAVILPPYNTVQAQVVQRGNPPVIVTNGLTVNYSILGNTTSANKAKFGQFWTYAYKLFGVSPAIDKGLNLEDPTISNGLSGSMLVKGTRFVVNGIPLTPINDAGVWNPFQTGIITVKDGTGAVVASTNIVVPTSDEINCSKCHGTTNAFGDILQKHDAKFYTNLSSSSPVLCASCHGSPALGQTGRGSSGTYMSEAIHASHANRNASCYDCHPGATTKCNRSKAHTDATGACTNCHGSMANVAATIKVKGRLPWTNEPTCSQCHTNIPGVDTNGVRFRDSAGHGQMACVACHNSPHAMLPSNVAGDSYSAVYYQGKEAAEKAIGSCGACHSSNHGKGFSGWYDEHGRSGAEAQSACNVCHTGFQNPIQANFPHQFQWNTRTATVGSGPVQNVPVVETPLPVKRAIRNDFLGNGTSDLLWRNGTTGQVYMLPMSGGAAQPGSVIWTEPNSAWQIVGTGDFDGDGKADILWWNSSTGQVFQMLMSGGTVKSSGVIYTEPNTAWKIVGTGDFDGDGRTDILWRNSSTGQVYLMPMNGSSVLPGSVIWTEPNPAWQIVALGDLDGDGKADILWWNSNTGQVFEMLMNGSTVKSSGVIYTEPNTAWKIVGTGDFNGDGKSDILWRNSSTGEVYLLPMNGSTVLPGAVVWTEPDMAWQIMAIGDFDGDGKDDIIWRNNSTGQVFQLLMNGTTVKSSGMIYSEPNLGWKIIAGGVR
jgi:hypothetical protein